MSVFRKLARQSVIYGLGSIFRKPGYYQTSALAELSGNVGAMLLPWFTAFECLIIATKPAD